MSRFQVDTSQKQLTATAQNQTKLTNKQMKSRKVISMKTGKALKQCSADCRREEYAI